MRMSLHTLHSEALTVVIDSAGAEMHSLKTHNGEELLWQADADVWGRHAPHLFPIVGRLNDDEVRHAGKSYPMSQHGFARDMDFQLESSSDTACTLLLSDSEESRKHFPFGFEFRVHYELEGATLRIGYDVKNTGDQPLPFSVGAHPAFNWPLTPSADRDRHSIEFEYEESADIRQLDAGLVKPDSIPTPLEGNTLKLKDDLFENDALVFDQHRSRQVTLKAEAAPSITIRFDDFPHLGIWTKPGADFICIEPWQGHASATDFSGEFADKPGIVTLDIGEQRMWWFSIEVTP
jgi:galactose mutarotase-like enzyme